MKNNMNGKKGINKRSGRKIIIKEIVKPLSRMTFLAPRTGITRARILEKTGIPLKKGKSLTMPKIPNKIPYKVKSFVFVLGSLPF